MNRIRQLVGHQLVERTPCEAALVGQVACRAWVAVGGAQLTLQWQKMGPGYPTLSVPGES